MPGVAVQPNNSPGSPGFGSSHSSSSKWMSPIPHSPHKSQSTVPAAQHNSNARFYDGLSVADVKQKAKESVNKEARGVSAITLIKTARTQILSARESEAKGDLRTALGTYIKAATLTKMAMDSPEYVQENRGKAGGVIRKELNDFLETEGRDISARTNSVEAKLKAIEKNQIESDGRDLPTGKSIKDRLRALQDIGLSIDQQAPKTTRELPTPPISPRNHQSYQINPLPSPISPSTSASGASAASNHIFVSPSTLEPPSPTSTTSASPPNSAYLNNDDLNGFNRAFPSIDELDGNPTFSLPSVPTTAPSTNNAPSRPALNTKESRRHLRNGDEPISPLVNFRNFTVPIERPSSTPITPTGNFAHSRPPSPVTSRSGAPLKPSGLSNTVTPSGVPTAKFPLPVKNTAFPKDLLAYIKDHNVLLIDVRNRAEFDREHIKGNAVVCIEPSILMRESVTADGLENAMVVSPRQEASLFVNRDKFDLVAVYDSSSTSFGSGSENSPLAILVRVIFENAFKKMLKRMPMLLVGGIEAWKRDLGGNELVRGPGYAEGVQIARPVPISPLISASAHGSNPFTNGNTAMLTYSPNGISPGAVGQSGPQVGHHISMSVDQSGHSRSPADAVYSGSHASSPTGPLSRRPALMRPSSSSISFTRSMNDPVTSPLPGTQPSTNGAIPSNSPISYPQFPRRISPNASGSGSSSTLPSGMSSPPTAFSPPPTHYDIPSPPQASINPSQMSARKRNDFVDQSQEALLSFNSMRSPGGPGSSGTGSIGMGIDYPELTSPTIIRPPPVAATSFTERQDNRPRVQPSFDAGSNGAGALVGGPKAPRIGSDYPVSFWSDIQIGTSGLKNLGNTCYMNAPIQCLSATVPFARFFTEGRWKMAINYTNPLGSKGKLTGAFAKLLHEMWGGDLPYLTPIDFRRSICSLKAQYNGSDQHDSQEFLSFLIDGIHEDVNRIMIKPNHTTTPEEEAELERLPPQIGSEREWRTWRSRNDSLIVDYFQGQFRNRLECLTCHKTSTTYNVFSMLSLPIPHMRSSKVPIEKCFDAFFNEEVLEKDDAWDCPQCKAKRRASKELSLARLPPVLMIHLKRFEANGRFSDKIDTFVDFPLKSLDLTNYMPPPLPPGADRSQLNGGLPMSLDDPRTQLPPYRYDLYGVTNHYGNLSSGHYTAFIASRGGWMYCDDSSVKAVDSKQVANQKAYVLFYKRARN